MGKKPNVIFATITWARYDSFTCRYRIDARDSATGQVISGLKVRFEHVSPHDGRDMVIWKNINDMPKYIAYDDHIATEMRAFDAPGLDKATRKHFNAYKRTARARLKIKGHLKEIEQNIATINMINTRYNTTATGARRELIKFLNTKAEKMRETLTGLIYR